MEGGRERYRRVTNEYIPLMCLLSSPVPCSDQIMLDSRLGIAAY